jgi:Tol biopolymer transport system component
MNAMRISMVITALALSGALMAQAAASPEALLKAAINRELVAGDVAGAMQQYKDIASKYAANHAVASEALLHLADLYERQGHAEARATYQRIVSQYSDTGETAARARARLEAIQQAEAGPFKERNLDKYLLDMGSQVGSPDGRWLAYTKEMPDKMRTWQGEKWPLSGLYVREIPTGKERLIADPSLAEGWQTFQAPVFSADGSRLVFDALVSNQKSLRIATVTSGEVRTVESNLPASPIGRRWSPDGQSLAYAMRATNKEPFTVRVYSIATGQSRTVGTAIQQYWGDLVWSPDSRRLAFVGDSTGSARRLQVATLATAAVQSVELPPLKDGRVLLDMGSKSWTAKDEIFVHYEIPNVGQDYYLVPLAGGPARRTCEGRTISGGNGCQELVLNGQFQIARLNPIEGGRLVLRSTIDGAEKPYTIGSGIEQTSLGGSSPDSRLLLFRSNRDGQWGLYIWPADRLPAREPILVSTLEIPTSVVGGWWTKTGLVVHFDNSQNPISRVPADATTGRATGLVERLTQDTPRNRSAIESPDGRRVAYVFDRILKNGLAVMDANGAHERVVLERRESQSPLTLLGWRSNDELLCLEQQVAGSPLPLFSVNVTTGTMSPVKVDVTSFVAALHYAHDTGELFYVTRGTEPQARALSLKTGATRNVIKLSMDWDDFIVGPGGRIVYSTINDKLPDDVPMPEEFHMVESDGRDTVILRIPNSRLGFAEPLSLSPNGRLLLYHEGDDRLMSLDLTTLQSQPVGLPNFQSAWRAHWSTDGRSILIESTVRRHAWRQFDGVTYDAVTKHINGKK